MPTSQKRALGPIHSYHVSRIQNASTHNAMNTTPHSSIQVAPLHLKLSHRPKPPAIIDLEQPASIAE